MGPDLSSLCSVEINRRPIFEGWGDASVSRDTGLLAPHSCIPSLLNPSDPSCDSQVPSIRPAQPLSLCPCSWTPFSPSHTQLPHLLPVGFSGHPPSRWALRACCVQHPATSCLPFPNPVQCHLSPPTHVPSLPQFAPSSTPLVPVQPSPGLLSSQPGQDQCPTLPKVLPAWKFQLIPFRLHF